MSAIPEDPKSWREELQALFGLRWDRFIEWALILWLSLWVWTSWRVTESAAFPTVGPIRWVAQVLEDLAVAPPGWLLATSTWLTEPSRDWLLSAFIVLTAACATFSARSIRYSGLRALALAWLILTFETAGGARPLLLVFACMGIPLGLAITMSWMQNVKWKESREVHYLPQSIVTCAMRGFGLFVIPIIAPVVILIELVRTYGFRPSDSESNRLAEAAVDRLQARESAGSDDRVDDAVIVASLAAMLLREPTAEDRRRVTRTFQRLIRDPEVPIGARRIG